MVMVIFAQNYQNYHFLHAVHVLELMGHPIGPKFGQYLQSIDIHVCIEGILEILIFGQFMGHKRSFLVEFPKTDKNRP